MNLGDHAIDRRAHHGIIQANPRFLQLRGRFAHARQKICRAADIAGQAGAQALAVGLCCDNRIAGRAHFEDSSVIL